MSAWPSLDKLMERSSFPHELPAHKDGRGRVSQSGLRRGRRAPHLHRRTRRACRPPGGVDVDVACRALQFITEQLMSETKLAVVDVDARPAIGAACCVTFVAPAGDFLSLEETAKRLGAKVAVAAWRRSVHDDLVETADAFLALDDRRCRMERGGRGGGRRRRREQRHSSDRVAVAAPRAGAAVDQWFAFGRGGADASRPMASCRALARVGAAGAPRRGDGERRWRRRRACAGPRGIGQTARPRGAPAHNLEAPELEGLRR